MPEVVRSQSRLVVVYRAAWSMPSLPRSHPTYHEPSARSTITTYPGLPPRPGGVRLNQYHLVRAPQFLILAINNSGYNDSEISETRGRCSIKPAWYSVYNRPEEASWRPALMAAVQVENLTHRHEAMLHFMLANPTISKGEVALRFGVTPAWLSVIINSQAFLEARALLTDQAFHETVLPMRERMIVVADKAIDRMDALIQNETDLDKVRKTAETVLQAVGFGAPSRGSPSNVPGVQVNVQNNHFHGNASAEVLKRAQKIIGARNADQGNDSPLRLPPADRGQCEVPVVVESTTSVHDDAPGSGGGVRATFLRGVEIHDAGGIPGSARCDQPRYLGDQGEPGQPNENLRADGSGTLAAGEGEGNLHDPQADLRHAAGSLHTDGEIAGDAATLGRGIEVTLHDSDRTGISESCLCEL